MVALDVVRQVIELGEVIGANAAVPLGPLIFGGPYPGAHRPDLLQNLALLHSVDPKDLPLLVGLVPSCLTAVVGKVTVPNQALTQLTPKLLLSMAGLGEKLIGYIAIMQKKSSALIMGT